MAAAGRRCSGYLLELGGGRFWLDAGSGTLAELLRHSTLDELDAASIGHLHADHWTDLPLAVHTLQQISSRPRPLPILGPRGFVDQVGVPLRKQLEAEDPVFEPHELQDRMTWRYGDVVLQAFAMEHGGIDAFGVRLDADGASFAYSGDTGPCEALRELAHRADVLLCEAGAVDEPVSGHLTPEQAAATAQAAGAGRLVLTHLPAEADGDAVAARARAVFGGEVAVARDGAVFTVR